MSYIAKANSQPTTHHSSEYLVLALMFGFACKCRRRSSPLNLASHDLLHLERLRIMFLTPDGGGENGSPFVE